MNVKKILFLVGSLFIFGITNAQTTDDLLNVLIKKGLIKQNEADSIRANYAIKQQDKPKDKIFSIDLQIKNRLEIRNGYGNIPDNSTVASSFVNQRTRLNFNYQHSNLFNTVVSLQDARVWGSHDPRGLNGTIQLFEGYVETFLNSNLSIKIGRQRIMFDNQRLFAENDWRINAAAHDAVDFKYSKSKLNTELVTAFNQTGERNFGTDYTPAELSITPGSTTPATWTNYKVLGVHYLKYDFTPSNTLTTIITSDGYQDATSKETIYWRFTYGGRYEFKTENWYATFSGYSQTGRNASGKTLKAWYIQPEVKYTIPDNLSVRLGAEVLSGDNGTVGDVDHNFVPLYGVAHRFNGFMDLFTRFPGDLNNAGLVNPYLFVSKTLSPKLEIGSYSHLFFTQKTFVNSKGEGLNKYMGYENDFLINYKPTNYTSLETGVAFTLPTDTLTAIKKVGESGRLATWFYVQLKINPRIFKSIF